MQRYANGGRSRETASNSRGVSIAQPHQLADFGPQLQRPHSARSVAGCESGRLDSPGDPTLLVVVFGYRTAAAPVSPTWR